MQFYIFTVVKKGDDNLAILDLVGNGDRNTNGDFSGKGNGASLLRAPCPADLLSMSYIFFLSH
jgi:hypothetical protein